MGRIKRWFQGSSSSRTIYSDSKHPEYGYEVFYLRDENGNTNSFTLGSKDKITNISIEFPNFFGLTKHTYDKEIEFKITLENEEEEITIFNKGIYLNKATVTERDKDGKPTKYKVNYMSSISFDGEPKNTLDPGTYSKLYLYNKTTYSITQKNNYPEGTIIIDYETAQDTPPSVPTFTNINETIVPGSSVTINWNASTPNDSARVSYNLYRNGDKIYSGYDTQYIDEGITSAGTYVYRVQAIGKNTYGENTGLNSNQSSPLTIIAQYALAPVPNNLKVFINNNEINKSNIDIGSLGVSSAKLTWDEVTTNNINPFQHYAIYKNEVFYTSVTTPELELNSPFVGVYKIQTILENNSSNFSDPITINLIDLPSPPIITTQEDSNQIYNDLTLEWADDNSEEVTYEVQLTVNNIQNNWIPVDKNSYTIILNNNSIKPNDIFKLSIRSQATAPNGGYSYSSITTSKEYVYISPLKAPDNLWKACYNNKRQEENLYYWGYNSCTIEWNNFTSEIEDDVISYIVKIRINENGNWTSYEPTTSSSKTFDITRVNEGSTLYFQITAQGKYNSLTSNQLHKLTIIPKPQLTNIEVPSDLITRNDLQVNFKLGAAENDKSSTELKYEITLGYDSYQKIYIDELAQQLGVTNYNKTINIELKKDTSNEGKNLINKLYNDVIGDLSNGILGFVKPSGYIIVKAYNSVFPECFSIATVNFNFNFADEDFVAPDTISLYSVINPIPMWYNPNESFSFDFAKAEWTDPLGQSSKSTEVTLTGGKIKYIITGNNKTIELYEDNISTETVIHTDSVLSAFNDTPVTYTLKTQLIYADYIVTSKNTPQLTVDIARWSNSETIKLGDIFRTKNEDNTYTITGKLILPPYLCGSKTSNNPAKNLSKVQWSIIDTENKDKPLISETINFIESTDRQPYKNETKLDFEFNINKENINFYGQAIFTNTKEDEIKELTSLFAFHSESVSLAIRKERIGINVDSKSFILDSTSSEKSSALYVAASQNSADNAAVVEIVPKTIDNPNLLRFLREDTETESGWKELGLFKYNDNDRLIHCDNFYYPPAPSAEDIGARPNTWMPTAGNGISINEETIINSGILDIFPSTNFADNYGKITFYKTINDSVTNVSKTEEIAIPISGFAKLSNPYIFDSLSIEGLAEKEPIHLFFRTKEVGDSATDTRISVYNNSSTTQDMIIQCSSKIFIGNGESAFNCYEDKKENTNTNLFFTSDNNINFFTNCGTYTERKECYIDMSGQFYSKGIRGDAIRYGSNTPTDNLVVGQIWLKPKN